MYMYVSGFYGCNVFSMVRLYLILMCVKSLCMLHDWVFIVALFFDGLNLGMYVLRNLTFSFHVCGHIVDLCGRERECVCVVCVVGWSIQLAQVSRQEINRSECEWISVFSCCVCECECVSELGIGLMIAGMLYQRTIWYMSTLVRTERPY